MCAHHSGLAPLSPWMVDPLAPHCIMNNPARQVLPINVAFCISVAHCPCWRAGCSSQAAPACPTPADRSLPRPHRAGPAAQDQATATAQTYDTHTHTQTHIHIHIYNASHPPAVCSEW